MTCSDVERALPEFLDGTPDSAFPTDFDAHVKSCSACSDLISDLKLISSEARQLAGTEEPASRVWVRIAAELRAENLICEPQPTRPVLVPSSQRPRWRMWWLAPVAAALVAAGSYLVNHEPAPPLAKQQAPATPAKSPAPETPTPASHTVPTPAPPQLAQTSPKAADNIAAVSPAMGPQPSAEDQQFLSEVSTRAPSMRATYENQLRAVNADIRETQAYVDQNPEDADARQHLMDAYQQKALLYQIALDRIQ